MLVSAIAGKPKKIVYKAKNDVLALNAQKFGQWTKNNYSVVQTDYLITGTGGKKEKTKFWLRIKSVNIRDKGLYSFRINDTVVGQWQLQVTGNCKLGLLNVLVGQLVSESSLFDKGLALMSPSPHTCKHHLLQHYC